MSRRSVRWSVYVLIAIVFAAICVFLSNWQFDRNGTRAAQIALVAQNYDAQPIALNDAIGADGVLDADDEWHPVTLSGEYIGDEQVFVRNRPHGGTNAFEALVPFRTDDGRVFLVDRGWVAPVDADTPETVPDVAEGHIEIVVRLRPGEAAPREGKSAPEGQVAAIHLPTVAAATGEDLITGAYGELVSEDPASDGVLGAFDAPTDDPGPYLSYAIQWILFAVMGFTFIAYIIRSEIIHNREDAREAAETEQTAEAERLRTEAPGAEKIEKPRRLRMPKKRRDQDADLEDEALDAEEQLQL